MIMKIICRIRKFKQMQIPDMGTILKGTSSRLLEKQGKKILVMSAFFE